MTHIGLFSEEIPGSFALGYEFLLRASHRIPVRNLPDIGFGIRRGVPSYFSVLDSSETISAAARWLLERYPQYQSVPAGYPHWAGKIAFAEAVRGARGVALRWAVRAMIRRPTEPMVYLTAAGVAGIPPRFIFRGLERAGCGYEGDISLSDSRRPRPEPRIVWR
jgi:hypothetical protein